MQPLHVALNTTTENTFVTVFPELAKIFPWAPKNKSAHTLRWDPVEEFSNAIGAAAGEEGVGTADVAHAVDLLVESGHAG